MQMEERRKGKNRTMEAFILIGVYGRGFYVRNQGGKWKCLTVGWRWQRGLSTDVTDPRDIRGIDSARERANLARLPASCKLSSSWNFTTRNYDFEKLFCEYEFGESRGRFYEMPEVFRGSPKDDSRAFAKEIRDFYRALFLNVL